MTLRNGWPRMQGETGVGDSAGAGGAGAGAEKPATAPSSTPQQAAEPKPADKPAEKPAAKTVVIKRDGEVKPAERKGLIGELDKVRQETQATRQQAEKTAKELTDERWDRALHDGKILPEYRSFVRSQLGDIDPRSDAGKAAIDAYAERHAAFKVPIATPADPTTEWAATVKKSAIPRAVLVDIAKNIVR